MTEKAAIVRTPSASFIHALSTHPKKHLIDVKLARIQHARYVSALEAAGIRVIVLPPIEDCPDATFVEDTVVIFNDVAVVCPMKEKSRQGESASILEEIKKYRGIEKLSAPVSLDGGDVLNTKEKLLVGISTRTNQEAADALSEIVEKPVISVSVPRGLHLKTRLTSLGSDLLVVDSSSIDVATLDGFRFIETGEADNYAANCLAIGETVLMPAGFPRVAKNIRKKGLQTMELEMSEFEKADGGLTCLSIILNLDVGKNL
ncbi:MAG: arginine deiminase family protein [Nitrospinaceae bacterium]|jgi:dimethylargininase|nr:arginine deiminase family protein [Nitrospinaceae bacterium]|tara:strand:+ start:471 stop:1250 length:780 start_codon:yes stop_codon:yes gene_type:complete